MFYKALVTNNQSELLFWKKISLMYMARFSLYCQYHFNEHIVLIITRHLFCDFHVSISISIIINNANLLLVGWVPRVLFMITLSLHAQLFFWQAHSLKSQNLISELFSRNGLAKFPRLRGDALFFGAACRYGKKEKAFSGNLFLTPEKNWLCKCILGRHWRRYHKRVLFLFEYLTTAETSAASPKIGASGVNFSLKYAAKSD